jgi:hypothetical protein
MTAGVAALIAHVAFWFLLGYGLAWQEIRRTALVVFLALWILGYVAVGFIPYGAVPFSTWVAVLDIALVFVIFKGDLPLT